MVSRRAFLLVVGLFAAATSDCKNAPLPFIRNAPAPITESAPESYEGARSLWRNARDREMNGDTAGAEQDYARASRILERLTGQSPIAEIYTAYGPLGWSGDRGFWRAIELDGSARTLVVEVNRSAHTAEAIASFDDERPIPWPTHPGGFALSGNRGVHVDDGSGSSLLLPRRGRPLFNPAGDVLLVGGENLAAYDPKSGRELFVKNFRAKGDGGFFLSGGALYGELVPENGSSAFLIDVASGTVRYQDDQVIAGALSSSLERFAVVRVSSPKPEVTLELRELQTPERAISTPVDTCFDETRLSFAEAERQVVYACEILGMAGNPPSVSFLTRIDIASGRKLLGRPNTEDAAAKRWEGSFEAFRRQIKAPRVALPGARTTYDVSPDGRLAALVTGTDVQGIYGHASASDVRFVVGEVASGRVLADVALPTTIRGYPSLAFSPLGRVLLACVDADPSVVVAIDIATGASREVPGAGCFGLANAAWSTDERLLATPRTIYDLGAAAAAPEAMIHLPFAPRSPTPSEKEAMSRKGPAPPWAYCRYGELLAPYDVCRTRSSPSTR